MCRALEVSGVVWCQVLGYYSYLLIPSCVLLGCIEFCMVSTRGGSGTNNQHHTKAWLEVDNATPGYLHLPTLRILIQSLERFGREVAFLLDKQLLVHLHIISMSDEDASLPETDQSNDPALWICTICSFAIVAGVSLSYKFIEPSNFGVAFISVVFLPTSVASYIFTELSVSLVGCVYPIYRATKAVCTPGEDDDKEWLQYWMLGGVIFMLTTWVDDVIDAEKANDVWLGSALFLFVWLYFPLTQGSRLVYEKFTDPVLGPHLKPLHAQMNNFILAAYQMLANATHLYAVWIIFMFLPAGFKRVVAIAVGTIYPFVSSVTAAATEDVEDDTLLFLRDSIVIKKQMLKDLDPERAALVSKSIAKFFHAEDGETATDPVELQNQMMSSWSSLKMPTFKMPFGKSEEKANEATPLV
eukprot:scaffold46469_cov60-Cyclotella_meneghiniana.AAC.1